MEKYLRGLDCAKKSSGGGVELSKWLESTANFQPNKNNYIEWESNRQGPLRPLQLYKLML